MVFVVQTALAARGNRGLERVHADAAAQMTREEPHRRGGSAPDVEQRAAPAVQDFPLQAPMISLIKPSEDGPIQAMEDSGSPCRGGGSGGRRQQPSRRWFHCGLRE